jgi:tol-pal system protein YbgF
MTVLLKSCRRRLMAPLTSVAGAMLVVLLALPVQARELPPIRESQSVNNEQSSGSASLSLADRVARLEDLLEGQALIEMLVQIEELQKNVQELRGLSEVYAHDVEGIKQRQRDLYMDIDRRLRQLMVTAAPVDGNSGQPSDQASRPMAGQVPDIMPGQIPPIVNSAQVGMTNVGSASQVNVDPQAEQASYRQAFNILKEGRYEDSIGAFSSFLQLYPEGQYADNAVYWMGEANYVLRRFPQAIENFKRVISQYPNSPKLADALLKIGFSQYELQAWPEARQTLEDLVNRYPTSTAGQLGNNRLHQMKVEGR